MKSNPPVQHKVIKNLIEAHSWLGLIISPLLFLVFWAGAVTLFHDEVAQWAITPHHPVDNTQVDIPLATLVEQKLAEYPVDYNGRFRINMPTELVPYYIFYLDVIGAQSPSDSHSMAILVDPKSGDTVAGKDDFYLSQFFYHLHYNLDLPGGSYLIGMVALIFLFALVSGIFIHARKLLKHFFLYRVDKQRRDKLLDLHTVVGVMTIPFTLMYALSGLILNLAIVFQLAFVVFIYQGDRQALFNDAGFNRTTELRSETPLDMDNAFNLIEQTQQKPNFELRNIIFHHYGAENALVQVRGTDTASFAQRDEVTYRVQDGSVINKVNADNYNVFRQGRDVLVSLHFSNFAGVDIRILYFILAMAISAMIVAGNMLWLDKRRVQRQSSPRSIAIVTAMTIGGCGGIIVATAVGFLCERLLPATLYGRSEWLVGCFVASLLAVMLFSLKVNDIKRHISKLLLLTSSILIITIVADWLLFPEQILALWQNGYHGVIGVQIGMGLMVAVCIFTAVKLTTTNQTARLENAITVN
ncbi:PepSY-associated TM helix domain-containing protein [Shewanella sp. H8]|uniref:PepSY-associated TM helix domain-containing protein n=1 Tax=Shewanella sp. H8 TaxID=3342676 RepID=UPI0033154187